MKLKQLLRELVIIPLILFILGSFIKVGYIYFNGNLSKIIFPTEYSILQMAKLFYSSILILIIFEYFVISDLPNNYLLSRLFSLLVMIAFFTTINMLYENIKGINDNKFILFSFFFAVMLGQVISLIIQNKRRYKYDKVISVIIIILTTTFIVMISI